MTLELRPEERGAPTWGRTVLAGGTAGAKALRPPSRRSLVSLAKPTWVERRELKKEDTGPEGGVVTWLGDFVGQSLELSLSTVGWDRDRVFPSVVGATRLPRAVAAHQGALQTPLCPAWLGMGHLRTTRGDVTGLRWGRLEEPLARVGPTLKGTVGGQAGLSTHLTLSPLPVVWTTCSPPCLCTCCFCSLELVSPMPHEVPSAQLGLCSITSSA